MAGWLIRTDGLSKEYRIGGATVAALRDVSLTVALGEFVAVMGPSGSGKSTLLNLLGLLDQPDSGHYWLGDQDLSGLNVTSRSDIRNSRIGFVFQNFNLLSRSTAIENVELPLLYAGVPSAERVRRATAALKAVELEHRAAHWPRQLSGGEQQRVAVARAIVNEPALILADEPTGSLDSKTGQEIMALFQDLNRQRRTIILVSHDPIVAQHASRILTIRDGSIVGDEAVSSPRVANSNLLAKEEGTSVMPEAGVK